MTIQEFAAWVDGCLESAQSTQAAREAIRRKSESLRLNMSIGRPIQIGANPPGAIGGGGLTPGVNFMDRAQTVDRSVHWT